MDELEFRRRILADPNDKTSEMQEAKKEHSHRPKFASDLEDLDDQIDLALRVDVPEGLADKILFHQSSKTIREKKSTYSRATTALVAFSLGLGLGIYQPWSVERIELSSNKSLTQIALEHYLYTNDITRITNQQATLDLINLKLEPLGAIFKKAPPGVVTYINYNSFDGVRALHLALKTKENRFVDMFLVPIHSSKSEEVTEGQMKVLSVPSNHFTVVIVGDTKMQLRSLAKFVAQNLESES